MPPMIPVDILKITNTGIKIIKPSIFGKDQEVGGINTHDFHGVYLLGDSHGSDLGGDITAYFTR